MNPKLFFVCLVSVLVSITKLAAQCPPSGGGNFEGNLTITTACSVSADLVLDKKNITITSTGSLTITGNFDNDGNGNILIDGGILDVTGSLSNNGNGVITVQGGGTLDVGVNYSNGGNGTTNFTDGAITIGGDYTNSGNGTIDAGGVVQVSGDFTVDGNGTTTVSGGLSIGGTADIGSAGIDISGGGVLQAGTLISEGDIDIDNGGTINVTTGNITGTVNNDPANGDQDCTNNCCGDQCNATGDELGSGGLETLPIELVYFNANSNNSRVVLTWKSASELNNDFFTIERSFNGTDYQTLTYVDGAGTTSESQDYSYTDYPLSFGLVYYRLTQTDFDGQSEQFETINVLFQGELQSPLVYPTQLSLGDDVTIDNFWGQIHSIEIYFTDIVGRDMRKARSVTISDKIYVGTSNLRNGIFLLSGSINGINFNQRLIIRD